MIIFTADNRLKFSRKIMEQIEQSKEKHAQNERKVYERNIRRKILITILINKINKKNVPNKFNHTREMKI